MRDQITIYGWEFSTYVRAVMLCCEEKGIEYRLEEDKAQWPVTPFQRRPVIAHNGFVLYETAAICRYLDRVFAGPSLQPSDVRELAIMDQWISAANAYFDPAIVRNYLLAYTFPQTVDGKPDMRRIAEALPVVKTMLEVMNQVLAKQVYFSGQQPGIADYIIVPMIDYLRIVNHDDLLSAVPEVCSYLARMRQRPSVEKILRAPKKSPSQVA